MEPQFQKEAVNRGLSPALRAGKGKTGLKGFLGLWLRSIPVSLLVSADWSRHRRASWYLHDEYKQASPLFHVSVFSTTKKQKRHNKNPVLRIYVILQPASRWSHGCFGSACVRKHSAAATKLNVWNKSVYSNCCCRQGATYQSRAAATAPAGTENMKEAVSEITTLLTI